MIDKGKIRIVDELITYVYSGTESVKLMDKFEGYLNEPVVYKRIVVKNTQYSDSLFLKKAVGVNLVIERSIGFDFAGEITFTNYKQGRDSLLTAYLRKQITDEIVDEYLNKKQFFRFSTPFKLKAQNSLNRTGYGWEWDWSGGIGTYTPGTYYGETTNYVFVGAFISFPYRDYVPASRLE